MKRSVLREKMNVIDLIKKRTSTRSYSSRPVSREDIESCLEAARLAPSACNSQPWSFIVVDNPDVKNKIVKKALSGIYRMNNFVKDAPVLIVVITELSTYIARMGGQLRNVKYSLIDIGIACDHLILRATELGLGTCWLGWFNENAVKKVLELSKSKKIDVMISLGYRAEEGKRKIKPAVKKMRKSLDKIRHYYVSENKK
jgi:nitroreductase